MKPIIILAPDVMQESDIQMLRENGLCVVVSKDPASLKFVDPLPAASSRTEIENAAIGLSRILLNGQWGDYSNSSQIGRSEFATIFVDLIANGTALDANGSRQEQEQRIFDNAKVDELRRLAREEAKAEREEAKRLRGKTQQPSSATPAAARLKVEEK